MLFESHLCTSVQAAQHLLQEPVHNLREAAEVANGKASTLGASLEGMPPEIGKPKLVVDLGHTDLHGNVGETVNEIPTILDCRCQLSLNFLPFSLTKSSIPLHHKTQL
jgi:hypothetical protein